MKLAWTCALFVVAACGDNAPAPMAKGIFAKLGDPLPSATADQLATFARGKAVALRRFSPDDGLGPSFNVTFCTACHERPVTGGGGARYRNFLLQGQDVNGMFTPTGVNGVLPQFSIGVDERTPTDPHTNVLATRNAVPFYGVGLLAEIPEDEILSRADPDDKDGDGISGRPNMDHGFVGRFGLKAQNASIEQFIRGPLFNHLGITSNPLPNQRRAELPVPGAPTSGGANSGSGVPQVGAPDMPLVDNDGVPDPELGEDDLFDLVSFSMLLAVAQPAPETADTRAGKQLFEQANCTGCHVPALRGPRGMIPAYTDLLIHDMGPALDDGIVQGVATGAEWRTAPLWNICATGPYLHDGRADTLDDAIRLHGGEAQRARDAYVAMTDQQRAQIIAFLDSLGGYDQITPGLLPPNTPLPDTGAYGAAMPGADATQFARGRAVFDANFAATQGLGPVFNGDSCRACHFDPVIGGSGPPDVDVIRTGNLDLTSGVFTPPSGGTIAEHFSITPGMRPPIDASDNVFEARQPPPLFGLGLIDQIPDATILSHADPNDADGDGISGRADILSDGRLGRLGWKADVPSLEEFARDALEHENGITVPDQPGLTFGTTSDSDSIPDPEISLQDVQDLDYFMTELAPPPRTRTDPATEDRGQVVFGTVGCAKCHVPSMQTADGQDVPLYSDLLLHDVAQPWQTGVTSADAAIHEFRTPPLWGLAKTAPYMHDGSAATVEEAIMLHGGEAAAIRDAFLALSPGDRAALLAFLRSL